MKKETTLVAALLCAAVSFGELSTLTPKVLKASWVDAWWRKKGSELMPGYFPHSLGLTSQ